MNKQNLLIMLINNINLWMKNDLDRIITNDEDPDGYHVSIGTKKWMKQKN